MRKTVYLLNVGDYAPDLVKLTRPHVEFWADKIGAEVYTITERKFPRWNVAYEKLQIHDLARERDDAWSIYIDSDALVHPELPDVTALIPRDTVAHNGADFASYRWRYDEYFLRDGRNIGSCNWFAVASDWCRDLWRPLDDLTFKQAVANIRVTVDERNPRMVEEDGETPRAGAVIRSEHLVDDYALSRNIARFGLKFTTLHDVWVKHDLTSTERPANFFHHEYTLTVEAKIQSIAKTIERWRL